MSLFDQIAKSVFGQKGDDGKTPLSTVDNAADQTPEERELVSHIRGKIDTCRQMSSRITQEGVTFTNMAYLMGYGGVVYDVNLKQFKNIDPKRRLSRNMLRINKILPTVQNRLARLTQSPPKYDVRPNSNSSEDKDCARLGLQLIENVFDKQNFVEKQQEVLMNAMQGGVGYIQVTWDPTLGKPMNDPETGEFMGYEGDIRLEVLNLLEVFPDPLAKTLDDAQWVIKAKVRKLDYFKERYKERGLAVKEEDVWLMSSIYDLKQNGMSSLGISGTQTSSQMKNSAIELVYYEKKSQKHPNGRRVISANGILLEDGELPIGEFDIVKFDDILIGGRFYSEAIITHLRPIQDQYTVTRTKCAEWVKKTLGGKYLVAKGAGLSQEALNDDSGEVVEYNPVAGAAPPQAMTIPMIPNYVYEDIKTLSQEFDFISGINETSRGVAPGADMPFRAMQLLVEQDQTRISVQTNRNELAYARVGCCILKYAGKFMEVDRMIKVAGDGLEYTVKEFKGSDLNKNYDVIVIAGSTVPGSKALKRQEIMNLYMNGLLGNPGDPKLQQKMLKIMEYGDLAEVWKDQALNEQQVKKLIASIEDGSVDMSKPGHEWDDHAFFIREMDQYRKTDKYENLSDKQKAQFEFIAEWHLQAQVQRTQPQIAQQQFMAQHMVNTMQNTPMPPDPSQLPPTDQPGLPPQGGPMPMGA